jgi:hypothetical protein
MLRFKRYDSISADPYREVREVLHPKYRNRSPEDVEAVLESANINAEVMEDFLATVGDFGKKVAGALLPVAGTALGTAYGGPVGGAAGGAVGSALGGALAGGQTPGQPPQQQMPSQPVTPQLPGASPAAWQLLQMIFRPELLQALAAMCMGRTGAPNIPVGNASASPGAFTNMISALADQASAEYNAAMAADGESIPSYLLNFAGEVQGDIMDPEYRALRLREMLQEADFDQEQYYREDDSELQQLDEWVYEDMELARLYSDCES